MTPQEILKYQKRAKYVAIQRGFSELADDFSQELFVEFLQNPDRGATVDQLFIDYLRRTHGRPGTLGGDARIAARNNTSSIDAYFENDECETIQLPADDAYGSIEYDSGPSIDFRECSFLFRGREAQIYDFYFLEERTECDIGMYFEISESRISQILKKMKAEIESYVLMKEFRERSEWDTSLGLYHVNWITL